MAHDRGLRLHAIKYIRSRQHVGIGCDSIGIIIAWKRRYKATGDVKIKIRCPDDKKISPEKYALLDNCEQGYEFSVAQIARFRTSRCKETRSETKVSELV